MKDEAVIFGRGKYYHFKKEALFSKYEIIGFLDNMVIGEEKTDDGRNVYNPSKCNVFPDTTKIILMAKDWFSMLDQLIGMDISRERIVLGMMEAPPYDEVEKLFQEKRIVAECDNNGKIKVTTEDSATFYVDDYECFKSLSRKLFAKEYKLIEAIQGMQISPSSRNYGAERGKSIDRVYIEDFLEKHKEKVHGVCMELGDDTYTRMFGKNVERTIILHVYGKGNNVIKGDFETGDGLDDNSLDCLICTQALQAIFELRKSIRNIYRALKPGGSVLITVSGAGGSPVSMNDYHNWGVYWRFTDLSLRRLLEEVFPSEAIEIQSYGNVKTMMAFQYGMCAEELKDEDYWTYDEKYPMIISAVATKP